MSTAQIHAAQIDDSILRLDAVVHDLGNLIQIATSAVRLMSGDPALMEGGFPARAITEAGASLERAGTLVREFLRPRQGISEEDVNLADRLERLRPLLEHLCASRSELVLRSERLPKITCRPLELDNAILNLAMNALDAMPRGGTLTIAAEAVDGPEIPEIELVVADTGVGMAPDLLARVTEPYFTTKPEDRGVGIGLASVSMFVMEARGRMQISSAPGAGTTVTLRLPASGTSLFS